MPCIFQIMKTFSSPASLDKTDLMSCWLHHTQKWKICYWDISIRKATDVERYVFTFPLLCSYIFLCILIVRPCILIVVYVYLLLSMYSYCFSMYSYRCLRILIVVHVFLDAATLTEVFPCFFLGCKANARV